MQVAVWPIAILSSPGTCLLLAQFTISAIAVTSETMPNAIAKFILSIYPFFLDGLRRS